MKIIKFVNKYLTNIIIIILCSFILVTYHLMDRERLTERYWIRKSRPVYNIINYIKIIIKLSLVFNIKFILLDILSGLSIL